MPLEDGSLSEERIYPLGMTNIAVENHHLKWENLLQMVIFNSYVKLPEGIYIAGIVDPLQHE